MQSIRQDIAVRFEYAVHFTEGLFDADNPLLRDVVCAHPTQAPVRLLVAADEGVCRHHPGMLHAVEAYARRHAEALTLAARPLVVPGGEPVKNDPRHVEAVQSAIHAGAVCRHSYVVAVGGGAVLDMVGYAAATAHRGVRLLRVPTTVLSQNDSGVGVKNSVNAFGTKNFLGTFAPPYAVINDSRFLCTLGDRDWRGGISEAVKVALIKDAAFFDSIERGAERLVAREMPPMRALIYRCAELHVRHIGSGGDPFEMGSSRPLDFGHWAAHKLEQTTGYRLRHGEAVAIGVALDSTYAYLKGLLPEPDWRRVLDLLQRLGFALYAAELDEHLHERSHPACLLRGLAEFREHLGGELTIMLLRGIGEAVEVHDMDQEVVAAAIAILRARRPAAAPTGPEGRGAQCASAAAQEGVPWTTHRAAAQ
jgi:3-dehydroquinate synthase